jgi:hypothetical protein
MPTSTVPTTSPFATSATNAADVKRLIAAGLEHTDSTTGEIDWAGMPEAVRPFDEGGKGPIGYSRAWLIVRRAWLEVNQPKSVVTLPVVDASKLADGDNLKDATNRAWAKVIQPLRDEGISWGEISVRVGKPESKVRACFKATGNRKDLGDRIGKGGRFAYDEPEFYLEHRRQEGAHIPTDLKGKPKVEQLLNAKNAQGKVVKFQRAAEVAKPEPTTTTKVISSAKPKRTAKAS